MKKRLVCLTLALLISATQVVSVGAAREDELRQEQAQTSSQLDSTYSLINSLEEQKQALAAEIDSLDQNLVDVMVQINVLKQDITNKSTELKATKKDLIAAREVRQKQYEDMKKRIQYLYENGGDTAWFQMLLDAKDINELLTRAEYAQKLYDYDRTRLQEYSTAVKEEKELKIQLEGERAELVDMKAEQEVQQGSLETQLAEKKATSDDYEAQIATAQEQADAYADLLQQQTAEIARLEAERIAAEEEARRQAEAAAAAAQAAAEKEAEEAARAAEEAAQQNEASQETDDTSYDSSDDTSYEDDTDYEDDTEYDTSDDTEYDSSDDTDYDSSDDTEYDSSEDTNTEYDSSESADEETDESEDSSYDSSEDSSSEDTGSSDDVTQGETDEYGNIIDSTESAEVDSSESSSSDSSMGQAVANYALQFVGNPYVWGGTSLTSGADCSGFVQSVYAHFGISLARTSESQMYNGTGVSYADAQPGDLICYGSHIAIYLGGGQIVHASNSAPYPAGGIKVSDNAAYRTILAVRRIV